MDLQSYQLPVFYGAAAISAILIAEACYLVLSRLIGHKRGISRRLKHFDDGSSKEQVLLQLRREHAATAENALRFTNILSRLLVQSGLRLSSSKFLLMIAAICAAIFAICYSLLAMDARVAVFAGALGGIGGPALYIMIKRSRRQALFVAQLPDAMDVIVRSLRSGHPVPAAMGMIRREMAQPISTEFGIMVDEMTYGLDTERALRNMYDRVGSADLLLLIMAISTQMATGGNLAEILGNLTKIMRERFQLRRKVRALSSEGRVSAYALSVFPVIMFFVIHAQNPAYYGDVWNEPVFVPALVLLSIWAVIGNVIMFKMINFKY